MNLNWHLLTTSELERLKEILFSFYSRETTEQLIEILKEKNPSDPTPIFSSFRMTKDIDWEERREGSRAWLRVQLLKNFNLRLSSRKEELNFLDFGAGKGGITYEFYKQLSYEFPHLDTFFYATDVADWHGHSNLEKIPVFHSRLRSITLTDDLSDLKRYIPYRTLDVIFVEMVLHHLTLDERKKLYEIFKYILKSTGLLVIREHDVETRSDLELIQIQHLLYTIRNSACNELKMDLKSKSEFMDEFRKHGFSPFSFNERKVSLSPRGPTKNFYQILELT